MTRKSSSEEKLSRNQSKKNRESKDEKIVEENNRQNEFKTPAAERQEVPNMAFTTPEQYRQAIDAINKPITTGKAAKESIVYRRGIVATEAVMKNRRKKTEEDLYQMSDGTKIMINPDNDDRTVESYYPVLEQSEDNEFSISKSFRKSAHDELFQVAENKKGVFETYDEELGLKDKKGDITFQKAFYLARVKNKELHTFNTGHTGAIFNIIDNHGSKGAVTAGYFKESKNTETNEPEGWDADKNKIIKKVIDEAEEGNEKKKKESPIKATSELLKLAVEKVVRYEEKNREEFQYAEPAKTGKIDKRVLPYTADGLNLANDIEREFALKTSQAARDKWKMSSVALEGRFNFVDSDGEDYTYKDKKSIIKRKVKRTKILTSIHGGEAGKDPETTVDLVDHRLFSPIRSGTPYSDLNFDLVFEELEEAVKKEGKERYEAITNVFAQPTPGLKPSSDFRKALETETPEQKSARKAASKEMMSKSFKKNQKPTYINSIQNYEDGKDEFHQLESSVSTPIVSRKKLGNYSDNDIKFNKEYDFFTKKDLEDIYEDLGNKKAKNNTESLARLLNDDERFILLWFECEQNGFDFYIDRKGGFAEIKKDDQLRVICPIDSIVINDDELSSKVTKFVSDHENKNTRIIFSVKDDYGYKTLALDPVNKEYRYIDSMHDSKDGKIEHPNLKKIVNDLGYARIGISYKRQQYSPEMNEAIKVFHNNECAFHNVYNTIRIAQSNNTIIGSHLHEMNRYGMKMLGEDKETLTPEFARDNLRPFYDQFFERLKDVIGLRKKLENWCTQTIQNKESHKFSKEDYDELSELVKNLNFEFNPEQKTKFSEAAALIMRNIDSKDLSLKNAADNFLTNLSEKDMLDHNYEKRGFSLAYRSIFREYKNLFSATCRKCDQTSLDYIDPKTNNTLLMMAIRNNWFEGSKIIAERISADLLDKQYKTNSNNNNKTALAFIDDSKFEENQKEELCKIINSRNVKPLETMSKLADALPSSSPNITSHKSSTTTLVSKGGRE